MRIFRNPPRTWALLSLGFYLFVAFIHNGHLQELGLPFIGPWIWIRQANLTGPVGLHFYPLQLSLSLLLVRCYWEREPIRVTVKKLQVDGSMFIGWWLKWLGWRWQCQWVDSWKRRGHQVYKHLTSCPETLMVHDTCHFSIGFYLGLKHHFVFRALFL